MGGGVSYQAVMLKLSGLGVSLQLHGKDLIASPPEKVTPYVLDLIASNRGPLLRGILETTDDRGYELCLGHPTWDFDFIDKLRKRAGSDWPEIAADPVRLNALAALK